MKLVFATNNRHKLFEISGMLNDRFDLLSLSEIGCFEELPEDGDTLEANASQKAAYLFRKFGVDCFADDTGLEVEALGGEPGVYSARFAGEGKNSMDNMLLLLKKMSEIKNRKARFRTVISLVIAGKEHIFEGTAEGEILTSPRGRGGFGYDPVFRPEGYELSFAELSPEEKNQISHRGKAFRKMAAFLMELSELSLETDS